MRLGWRLAAAFGGCLKSRAGPPAGSTARGIPATRAEWWRPATVRLCWSRSGLGGAAWWRCCLWLRSVLGPSPRQRLKEADRSGGVKPDHTCWPPVSFGWTPPARSAWLRPQTRRGTQNTTPRVLRIHRTAWPVQAAPCHRAHGKRNQRSAPSGRAGRSTAGAATVSAPGTGYRVPATGHRPESGAHQKPREPRRLDRRSVR